MKLYGYKSGCIKINGRGICWCYDCAHEDERSRSYRKRNRKRARRQGKEEINEQNNE